MKYGNLKFERFSDRITRIIDTDVYMYLVEGDERACLIDCGHGIGDSLKTMVNSLTEKPVFLLLTHNHEDHIGGSGWFNEVYINEYDLDGYCLLKEQQERFRRHQNAKFSQYPLESYAPVFPEPQKMIDGQEFDLGNLTLKSIYCGGHTKGSMIVLVKEERVMIFGDAIGRRVSMLKPGLHVSKYLENLKHVKKYEKEYDVCLRCHNELTVPLETVDNLIDCCIKILDKSDDHQEMKFYHADGTITECYTAYKVAGKSQARIDGKIGNIFYTKENAV